MGGSDMVRPGLALAVLLLATSACGDRKNVAADGLARVAAVHGAAGPFAVAGYRMGERALRELAAQRGSFDLEVVHESPAEVQWSCIADGLQAATGTSAGKLNLKLVVTSDHTSSLVRSRSSGKAVRFSLAPAFLARFKDVPREHLGQAGVDVMKLRDEEIFDLRAP